MEKTSKKRKSVQPVPEGFQTVTPYLIVDDAKSLIEFIKKAFDGEVSFIQKGDDDRIMHATVKIGDSSIMISDTMDDMEPETAMLYLYVEDVDAVYQQAIKAKGNVLREPKTEFYGDRAGAVKDNWGNKWWIATHVEDVDRDELEKRTKEALKERKEKDVAQV